MMSAQPQAGGERLAVEQAALRRVATLVARGSSPAEVFEAVTREAARVLGAGAVGMIRFEPDETATLVARSDTPWDPPPLGTRFTLDGENIVVQAWRTGKPVRTDDWTSASGSAAAMADVFGVRSSVATPIVVEGRTWGLLIAATNQSDPLPPSTESRVQEFTELVATAIANAEARRQLSRLADEQAALRRVATLVAQRVPPAETFAAVSEEVGRLFGSNLAAIARYEEGIPSLVYVAVSDEAAPILAVGTRWPIEEGTVSAAVYRTGRSTRADDVNWSTSDGGIARVARRMSIASTVASPIMVEGRLWGAAIVASTERLPDDAEERLTKFTDLAATAIANAEARHDAERLAEEQAALRRVATLVARGVPAHEVFSAVSDEVARLFGTTMAAVARFDPEEPAIIIVGAAEQTRARVEIGSRFALDDAMIATQVHRTGRSAWTGPADLTSASPAAAEFLRQINRMSSVASPIFVDGRLWGVITVTSETEQLSLDTQEHLEEFTELVATALANAEARRELIASRARIVAASDDARRRIERDLHDGAQQRLVSLGLELRIAAESVSDTLPGFDARLGHVADEIDAVIDDLRETSRGIHPAILSDGGLWPAIEMLARRAPLPVELDLGVSARFAPQVEVAVYYVVSEALTNTAKHANATRAHVSIEHCASRVRLAIDDDGEGGAKLEGGSGLAGLRDRVEALGGSFSLRSSPVDGTVINVELPVTSETDMAIP
jgi:signal transduction histidine kinase